MLKRMTLLLLLLCLSLTARAQEETPTLTVADIERTYTLHVPADLATPAPLVIVLHGRFGSGASIARYTGFDALADEQGFIVAYPDALEGEWNYVRRIPGYPVTHDDAAFLVALVDHLAAQHPVDLSRVYITGFSNGGFMAQRVACEDPARFAAFASVAAAGFGGMEHVCMEAGSTTAPMLLINGTDDDNIRWEGNSVTRGQRTIYVTYPVPETLGYWAAFNTCDADAETTDIPAQSPETQVRVLTVACPEDASVMLYAVIGGGHNWPGHEPRTAPELFGHINHDIDATEVIWNFFAPRVRPQPVED